MATKKGSDLSEYVNDLVQKWAEDGTLEKLVEDNGVQPSYVEETEDATETATETTEEVTEAATEVATEAVTEAVTE